MLARTAANLYWIGRYIERAETAARLLEVGARNALMPSTGSGYRNEWDAVLAAGGNEAAFAAKYGEVTARDVETFLFFDRDNPSSVAACLGLARENGRIVRTALTTQVWEALNGAFQELCELQRTERSRLSLSDLTDWTVRWTASIRGAMAATQLRNDGRDFVGLGLSQERFDATARMIDVKYYVLLPQVELVGSGLDSYQWGTLLRAMSAHRAFFWVYGGEITADKIVHFLVLNTLCPRSLLTCLQDANDHLDRLARGYGRSTPAQEAGRRMLADLAEAQVADIFEEGLHEFLRRQIAAGGALGEAIDAVYLRGEAR